MIFSENHWNDDLLEEKLHFSVKSFITNETNWYRFSKNKMSTNSSCCVKNS